MLRNNVNYIKIKDSTDFTLNKLNLRFNAIKEMLLHFECAIKRFGPELNLNHCRYIFSGDIYDIWNDTIGIFEKLIQDITPNNFHFIRRSKIQQQKNVIDCINLDINKINIHTENLKPGITGKKTFTVNFSTKNIEFDILNGLCINVGGNNCQII